MSEQMTVIQATRRLGITVDALYRLIYSGRLPAHKKDGKWQIPSEAVAERLRQREARNG